MNERWFPSPTPPSAESLPRPSYPIESIPREDILATLQLTDAPGLLRASVSASQWGSIGGGRMLIESRNIATFLQGQPRGTIHIYDFDDCLMSTSRWHNKEYNLIEQSPRFRARGIEITAKEAKELYERSKITVPGFAEMEARYTPTLNMVLLTRFAEEKKIAQAAEQDPEKAWTEVKNWLDIINSQIQRIGERALDAFAIDPDIKRIFMNNNPSNSLHTDFVDSMLGATHRRDDLRIIATRGMIGGSLGQVYKVHLSGLMSKRRDFGGGIDAVIYSNDIKAEALLALMSNLPNVMGNLPNSTGRLINIYDDNPNEVIPYLGVIKALGAPNIEVIQVSHPDAKRKDLQVNAIPTAVYQNGDTILRRYSLVSIPASQSSGTEVN